MRGDVTKDDGFWSVLFELIVNWFKPGKEPGATVLRRRALVAAAVVNDCLALTLVVAAGVIAGAEL